jgi:5-methylcytosine-specific restriction protein A
LALKRFCGKRGCNQLTDSRFCTSHQDIDKQDRSERHKHYDKHQRDRKAATFYNSIEWLKARQQALIRDHHLCQQCLKDKTIKLADMVDHIIPISIAWHLRVFLNNLQSLCHGCHNKKTAEDKKKYEGRGRSKSF